jgi:hypothetical protein
VNTDPLGMEGGRAKGWAGGFLMGMAGDGVQGLPFGAGLGQREARPYIKERLRYTGDSRLLPGLRRDLVCREAAAVFFAWVLRAASANLVARVLPALADVVPVEPNL